MCAVENEMSFLPCVFVRKFMMKYGGVDHEKIKICGMGYSSGVMCFDGELFRGVCGGEGCRECWKHIITFVLYPVCWNAVMYCNLSSRSRRMVGKMEAGGGYLLVTGICDPICRIYWGRNSLGAGFRVHYR